MSTSYFEKYLGPVTLAHCPGCGGNFRLVRFRKWWGDKRLLRELCDTCEPEKKLNEMTSNERANAVAAGRLPLDRALKIDDAQSERRRAARSMRATTQMLGAHSKERRRNWARALTDMLRRERTWAENNQRTPASEEWDTFFQAYERALTNALQRINLHIKRKGAPLKPSMEEARPEHWVFEDTRAKLRELYSACPVVRGRRLYRDPAFLAWDFERGRPTPLEGRRPVEGE